MPDVSKPDLIEAKPETSPEKASKPKPSARRKLPLERSLEVTVTAQGIAERWQEMGIETPEQLKANFQAAKQAAFGLVREDLIRALQKVNNG